MASLPSLSRPGVWQLDLKSFPHKHHPGWGGGRGCLQAGPAHTTSPGGLGAWVLTRAESTPSIYLPSESLAKKASFLLVTGAQAKCCVCSTQSWTGPQGQKYSNPGRTRW